ncbi:MAG: hypothetical protein MZV63_13385 [Marinilabiliales bacterium]|nr:hypothetical protein [Marinilabiliales bacterium]
MRPAGPRSDRARPATPCRKGSGRGRRRARLLPARPRLRLRRPAGLLQGPGVPPGLDRRPPLARPGPRFSRGPAPRRAGRPRSRELSFGHSRVAAGRDRPGGPDGPPARPADALADLEMLLTDSFLLCALSPRPRPGRSGDHPVGLVGQGRRRGPGGRPGEGPGGRGRAWRAGLPASGARRVYGARGKPSGTTDRSRPPAAGRDSRPDRSSSKGTGTPASRPSGNARGRGGALGGGDAGTSGPFRRRPRDMRSGSSSAATASSPTASSAPGRPSP